MGADADLIRRLTEEGFLGGDLGVVEEIIGDDFVSHDPPPGVAGTKEGQLQLARAVSEGFSDPALELHEVVDTADGRVVENWAMTGTHTGEILGVPASGQRVRVRGVDIFRCAGGKVVEHWGAVDMSDFLQKAGVAGL